MKILYYIYNKIKNDKTMTNNKTMTRKERKEFILNLDKVVKRWRNNSYLFCGGCCFSAGQIAKILEDKGIRYQVVCWQSGNPLTISLKTIVKTNNCNHVAIQVSVDGDKLIIGGDFDSWWTTNRRTYRFMKSKTIIDSDKIGVKFDTWNHRYDRSLNNRFINALNAI
jgi:hypothetical protein